MKKYIRTDLCNLSIVIPAYNEEGAVESVVLDLIKTLPGCQIIVVDDCSTDNTLSILSSLDSKYENVEVYHHIFNRGYGASLKAGMRKANRKFVAWFDSDGEHKSSDLLGMYRVIETQPVAAVIAQRENASVNLVRGVGKWLIWLLAIALKIDTQKDLNCGLRIFRKDIIFNYLSILPERYSASMTTTILMSERQYPVNYYAITTQARIGESKVKLRDGFASLLKVLRLVTLFAPLRLFFSPGLALFLAGIFYGIFISFSEGQGFPTAGLALSIVGGLLCVFGLIADQIGQLRLDHRYSEGIAIRINDSKND
jgi:glycosyltransferase involved in cell wall biosynthesis